MKTVKLFVSTGCWVFMAHFATPAFSADPATAVTALQVPAPAPAAKFIEITATADTLRQLRMGGYTLYLRHGLTDNTKADRVPSVDLDDCSTQRPLTEAGRQLMKQVGEGIRRARIPVGELHVSPMCRARQSATAAFPGLAQVVDSNLIYLANFTDKDKAPILANTRRLLSNPVPQGSNRLLLAHAPNLMDLIGYFPKEGTLVIFRPKGAAGFDYVASVVPARWPALLR